MNYGYYPGCSLERNASAYHESAMEVAKVLNIGFTEVDDWNCCGATEYMAIDMLPAFALISRNLALAANQKANGDHLVAPCSACFLNLSKADRFMRESPDLAAKVNEALAAGGLHYEPGSIRVRHLLDIIVTDIGYDAVAEKVTKPLYNLRLAPYYGCLVVRPVRTTPFDDPEYPTSLDKLMRAVGANVVDYPLKAQCCGGHMTQIKEHTALEIIRRLLKNAADYEADAIVTLCPMCQLNLDAYQENVNKRFGTNYKIPILYFTQLLGLAFGVSPKKLGFGKEFVPAGAALQKIGEEPPPKPKRRKRSSTELPMPTIQEVESHD
jgi:heterodisulfide reductase subunit B